MAFDSIWLTLAFPLLGAWLCGTQSGALGRRGTHWVACGAILAAFVAAVQRFAGLVDMPQDRLLWWLQLPLESGPNKYLDIPFGAMVDQLSLSMLCMVCGVAFLIHVFSTAYMSEERDYGRFFSRLNFFVATMVLLVLADNLVVLLIGWGGVGFASYSLIGFNEERPSAVSAARKAFLMNVVGDLGLMVAIFIVVQNIGSVQYKDLFAEENLRLLGDSAPLLCCCLLVAAYAKSAQLPLHSWLPDAMEGPTPVSALIHAATMVTAGVYLIVRLHKVFELSPDIMELIADAGAMTALVAALGGMVQTDLKRVLAYSTMSQLGYMFMACGAGAYGMAMFHLMTHAFFKALLFLSAGAVIHALHGEQDMRNMGGLWNKMPITHGVFLVGCLALAGIPPMAGFFSKEALLGAVADSGTSHATGLWIVGVIVAMLTAYYTFRAYALTFWGAPRNQVHHLHLPSGVMELPLLVLAFFTAFAGFYKLEFLTGIGLLPMTAEGDHLSRELLTVGLALVGLAAGLMLHRRGRLHVLPDFLQSVFGSVTLDGAYSIFFVKPVRRSADMLGGSVDQAFSRTIPDFLSRITWSSGQLVSMLQSGSLRLYALAIMAAVSAFLLFTFFSITFAAGGTQ